MRGLGPVASGFPIRFISFGTLLALLAGCSTVTPPGARPGAPVPSATVVPANPAGPQIAVELDAARRFQAIDGFGASAWGGFGLFERGYFHTVAPKGVTYKTTPEQRRAILTAAIRELGLTHARLWLPPEFDEPPLNPINPRRHDWSHFNWQGGSGQPASADMLANRGNGLEEWGEFLKITVPLGLKDWIVTPSSLPPWLLKKFTENSPDRFEQYADWAVAHLLFLKQRFGFEAPYWSPLNESDHLNWYDQFFWDDLIRTTGARFRAEGLATKLMVPDFMNAERAVVVATNLLRSLETRQYVGALAYHHYGTSGDGPQPFLKMTANPATADGGPQFEQVTGPARAMAELGRNYRLPSWETETAYYPKNYKMLSEWEIGRGRANEVYYELSAGASAMEGMFLVWPDAVDPRYGTSVRSEGHPILLTTDGKNVKRWKVSKDTGAVLGHYARFIKSGDWRIQATCNDPTLRLTGFVSDANRRCVLVVVNNSDQRKSISIQLRGLGWKPGHSGALMTNASQTLEPWPLNVPTGGSDGEISLPALSLCTLVWSEASFGPLALPSEILRR